MNLKAKFDVEVISYQNNTSTIIILLLW